MQLYFGTESWDKKRLLASNNFTTDYQGKTLQFCREWMQGKIEFELQTSGSTGKPKTIRVRRIQMQKSAEATAQKLGLRPQQMALICLNTNYIAGKMMLVRCMEIGMNARIVEPSANPLKTFTLQTTFDFAAFVPMQLDTILEQSPEKIALLNQMNAIIIGGAPIQQELTRQLQHISAPIYATYGMTETVSHIALKRLNGTQKQGYYEVLPNVKIGQDKRNCLTISAPMTLDKPLITNDIVRLISDTQFEWLGRFDNIINSGGIKIQPEKIERMTEQILTQMALEIRLVVMGVSDKKLGTKIVLCLESYILPAEMEEHLKKQLQQKLHPYEIPKQFLYFQTFPTTPTGKISRQQILELIQK